MQNILLIFITTDELHTSYATRRSNLLRVVYRNFILFRQPFAQNDLLTKRWSDEILACVIYIYIHDIIQTKQS